MKRLAEVETAKGLMTEAMKWSVMTWLREKKRVRKAADQANAALDRVSSELKKQWPETVRSAYATLADDVSGGRSNGRIRQNPDPQASSIAKKLKDADDEAYRARMSAERTFDDAEKRLSTALAREGCLKAIQAWELHEKAIREAEKYLS